MTVFPSKKIRWNFDKTISLLYAKYLNEDGLYTVTEYAAYIAGHVTLNGKEAERIEDSVLRKQISKMRK